MKVLLRFASLAALILSVALPLSLVAGTFSDDFSEGLNTNDWSVSQSTAGLYSIVVTNDQVQFARIAPHSAGSPDIALVLNPQVFGDVAVGDFSEQVEFTNAIDSTAPPGPGYDQVELHTYFYDGSYFFDVFDNESGINVHAWNGSVRGLIPVNTNSGVFRIARTGNVLTGYYNGSPIYSETNIWPFIGAQFILQNNGSTDMISVAYANFSLTSTPPPPPNPAFNLLHAFTAPDGVPFLTFGSKYPPSGLVLFGDTLYGTMKYGGLTGNGMIFAINADGGNFTNLYSFSAPNPLGDNTDGLLPVGGLTLQSNMLYGLTYAGGSANDGVLFRINTDSTGFTNLFNFSGGNNGRLPVGVLALSGSTLYGVTGFGGINQNGNIFAIQTDGTGYTNLYTFTAITGNLGPGNQYTNSDGSSPLAGLTLSSNTLFGTTSSYGLWGNGGIFRINTDGTGFTNLWNFPDTLLSNSTLHYTYYAATNGAKPEGRLVLSENVLYGTTYIGGASAVNSGAGFGTVFRINTDGTGYQVLHSFDESYEPGNPVCDLILSNGVLYGTVPKGGSQGTGAIFSLNTDGSNFKTFYSFSPGDPYHSYTNSDGADPQAGVILSDNTLYGMTYDGGSTNGGTVFSLSLNSVSAMSPKLAIVLSGTDAVLSWTTNAAGFNLQSATNLSPQIIWTNVPTAPVMNSGQNTVTVPISGRAMFYRLAQ
ncbi:MAG TPA: choice-of-anchor tandem repeat GloVer-containing protein [Verrucomicrobiae bacterium]|jgi:uncharacterized repeat protein (TIGR03803 family)